MTSPNACSVASPPRSSVRSSATHLHLDEPVWERYGDWIGGVARGDLGRSLVNDETVTATIGTSAKNTLFLGTFAFLLYIPVTLDSRDARGAHEGEAARTR